MQKVECINSSSENAAVVIGTSPFVVGNESFQQPFTQSLCWYCWLLQLYWAQLPDRVLTMLLISPLMESSSSWVLQLQWSSTKITFTPNNYVLLGENYITPWFLVNFIYVGSIALSIIVWSLSIQLQWYWKIVEWLIVAAGIACRESKKV